MIGHNEANFGKVLQHMRQKLGVCGMKRSRLWRLAWAGILTTLIVNTEVSTNSNLVWTAYAETATEAATDGEDAGTTAIPQGEQITMDTKEDVDAVIDSMGDTWPAMPEVNSECAIAIEINSGTILYAKNATTKHYPASVTKIMTALLTVENCSLNEDVTFSQEAVHSLPSGASNIALNTGEILSVENCLYALLIPSANEVANGLAEHIAGSVADFAVMMNERAEEIGCVNTHFANANGLQDENHYSCAYDLALIFAQCVQNPSFLRIDSTPTYVIPPTNLQSEERPIGSTDAMLRKTDPANYDPDIICGKTGWTAEAKRCLVSYTEHDGMDIVICVLGAEETPLQYNDTKTIKNYCYDNFRLVNIADKDETFNVLNSTSTSSPISIPTRQLSLFSMDTEDYAILPTGIEFGDLDVELVYTGDGADFAEINYLYDGYLVGKGHLEMASDELIRQEFAATSDDEVVIDPIDFDTVEQKASIPWRYILAAVLGLLLIGVIVSFILMIFRSGKEEPRRGGSSRRGGRGGSRTAGPNFKSLSKKRK